MFNLLGYSAVTEAVRCFTVTSWSKYEDAEDQKVLGTDLKFPGAEEKTEIAVSYDPANPVRSTMSGNVKSLESDPNSVQCGTSLLT